MAHIYYFLIEIFELRKPNFSCRCTTCADTI